MSSNLFDAFNDAQNLNSSSSGSFTQEHIQGKVKDDFFRQSLLFLYQNWHTMSSKALLDRREYVNYLQTLCATSASEERENLINDCLGIINRSGLLYLHGELNKQIRYKINRRKLEKTLQQAVEQRADVLDDAKTVIGEMWDVFETKLLRFYQLHLNLTFDEAEFYTEASDFSAYIFDTLKEVAQRSRFYNQVIIALQDERKNGDSEKLGAVNAKFGQLSRQLLAAHVAVWKLYVDLATEKETSFSAQNLPFDLAKIPDGKNFNIHKVHTADPEKFVEVKGFVEEIVSGQTVDVDLVCQVKLYDPSSKKHVWIVAPYNNLRSMGVEKGAYLIVHGEVHHNLEYKDNGLAIHIDKLSLRDLKPDSWKLSLLDSAKAFYMAWYNGLNISWSLSPHRLIRSERKVESMGAAELVYSPLYRSKTFTESRATYYSTN